MKCQKKRKKRKNKMKERMMKIERFFDNVAFVLYLLADVMFIASLFIKDKAVWISILIFGWMLYIIAGVAKDNSHNYAIMYLKEDIGNLSYAINTLAENVREELYGTDEEETPEDSAAVQDEAPEADTKETMIVSPEDFERFQKGEMTKEELLGIKKAVDTVVEAKKKSN